MTTLERIRPCTSCGRMTRPSSTSAEEHPDTIVRGSVDLCMTCYWHQKPEPVHRREPLRDLVFAVVPDAHEPQQSECRIGCCKNPFMCGQGYRCDCHWRSR